jgi:hypothetical protein
MRGKQAIGRLALRDEGEFWNAYYAETDTMDGALLLGSLHMRAAQIPARKAQFMELMKEVVADIIQDAVGVRPEWPKPPQAAPEHERI